MRYEVTIGSYYISGFSTGEAPVKEIIDTERNLAYDGATTINEVWKMRTDLLNNEKRGIWFKKGIWFRIDGIREIN